MPCEIIRWFATFSQNARRLRVDAQQIPGGTVQGIQRHTCRADNLRMAGWLARMSKPLRLKASAHAPQHGSTPGFQILDDDPT